MNAYEMLKNRFIDRLTKIGLSVELMQQISDALDLSAEGFTVAESETALSVVGDALPVAMQMYLSVKKVEGLSEGTLENRFLFLKLFSAAVRKPLDAITPNDIRAFLIRYATEKGVSNASLDNVRKTICGFFRWAACEGYVQKDPGTTVRPIKAEYKQRQSLSQLELEYMRKACKTARERAIVETLYATGCRASELITLKISDVDFRTGEVHLFGKGRKHRTSFLNAKAHVALMEYLNERGQDGCEYLICSSRRPHTKITKAALERIIRGTSDRSGITKKVTPHTFRHTTATQALANGMPVEEVRQLLGHSNIATTMIYIDQNRDAVKAHHATAVL